MKNAKRSLMSSAIALLLCFSMLLGTTYAWFTDSASSAGNIIQSGNLNIEMQWSENLEDWNDVNGDPIFTYDNWEPGYTDVKYIKVKNAGSLAFKWKLNIEAEGDVGELAEVIDVYYINAPAAKITSLEGRLSVGVLSEVITNKVSIGGNLLPLNAVTDANTPADYIVGETVIAIAFHMDEEAGNKYQDKSIGDGFDVTLVATQLSFESDSFGNEYDVDAAWPNTVVVNKTTITKTVDVTTDGKVANAVAMSDGDKTSANIPAGVKLANGANELTLTITPLDKSVANVVLNENEAMMSLDVHIDGVADDNDVVMAIERKELLPIGLNMGNYRFYHVENGATVEMTLREDGATPVHNNYDYDPATGDVVLYLKSFSEVAFIASPSVWTGGFDYSWFVGFDYETGGCYKIANADQLAGFSAIVGGMAKDKNNDYIYTETDANGNVSHRYSFEGKTVKLLTDINLNNKIFYPIGYYNSYETYTKYSNRDDYANVVSNVYSFEGIFDGNGNTITNFYQNTWDMFGDYNDGYPANSNHYKDGMGLFGYVYNGTVKNLTVDKFSSDGEFTPTGVIAAFACNSTFENIAITNCNPRVYNTGNGGIVGIGGNSDDPETYKLTFKNITVDNTNKITALWGSWDVACGGLVGMFRGAGYVDMIKCHVAAQIDVYNDVCGNYQYYWYRYAGMLIGTNKNMTTDENGYTVPETHKFTTTDCTVHFDTWNDYYYCELVANSLASYTHDHQFSRLTQISSESEIQDDKGAWNKAGNFLVIEGDTKTCYHIVKNGDKFERHMHEDSGYETTDINGDGVVDSDVLKEDKQIVYLPFNQLFTGYGWGVKHIPINKDNDFAGVKILDKEYTDSNLKFEYTDAVNQILYPAIPNDAKDAITVKQFSTLTVGQFFKAIQGLDYPINTANIQVTVSHVAGKTSTVEAVYTPNAEEWTQGTISFVGVGYAKITITDYDFCIPTTVNIIVGMDSCDTGFDGIDDVEGLSNNSGIIEE